MKRTILTLLLSATALSAGAQTMYDALAFSRNDYFGTARSMGLGNAVTAVGGDLGSIGINPAGSAVAGYSQVTISPGLVLNASAASYSAYPIGGSDKFSGEQLRKYARMAMPNLGLTLNFSTGRSSGLKSVTYGAVLNTTSNYTDQMMASGMNDRSSYLGAMAAGAAGCDSDVLNGWLDLDGREIDDFEYAYYNTDYPFNSIVNAQAGAISNFGDVDDPDYYTRFLGATEGYSKTGPGQYNIFLAGPLDQAYGRQIRGSKNDIAFNVGFNFSDNFYVGLNLGAVTMDYGFDEYFKEAALDSKDFPIDLLDNNGSQYTIHFNNYRSRYSYSASGAGIYGKVGFIAKPAGGLRIGAAIQTPTISSIEETWQHAVDIHYDTMHDDGEATSPKGVFSYSLRSPYRLNAGVAYTVSSLGMVSVDYEMTDYSSMRFSGSEEFGFNSAFEDVNDDIRDCFGISQQLRVGAELKPSPEFAVRAGYNFTTTPETYGTEVLHDKTSAYSLGLGYSSTGSFFFDLAGRLTTLADEFISPYADYLDDCASPMILNKRSRWAVVATLGWRF